MQAMTLHVQYSNRDSTWMGMALQKKEYCPPHTTSGLCKGAAGM